MNTIKGLNLKLYFSALIASLCFISCENNYKAPKPLVEVDDSNQPFIDSLTSKIEKLGLKAEEFGIDSMSMETYGSSVDVYSEMIDLFDPDKFNCGLSEQVKSRIKDSERDGTTKKGFVPDLIVNNVCNTANAIKLDGRGANRLLHYFTYELADAKESEPIVPSNAPTQMNFSSMDWIDSRNESFSSFFFTMDCSGYFSVSAKVAAKSGFLGIGRISVEAEGEKAISQSQSILVMRVLAFTPLYAAYSGSLIFQIEDGMSAQDKIDILNGRLSTIQAILDAIPNVDRIDARRVILNKNYETIITSNKGNSGYNGTGKLNTNIEINFVAGQGFGSGVANNSVRRKSEYTSYNTYILQKNVDARLDSITIKDLKDRISEIQAKIAQIQLN